MYTTVKIKIYYLSNEIIYKRFHGSTNRIKKTEAVDNIPSYYEINLLPSSHAISHLQQNTNI
jgi:hypothetical protein